MKTAISPSRPADYTKKVGLVLQGGGALGSYQAGAFEALAAADYHPDWMTCISIGAINGALIAGNAPKERVARLRYFWDLVTKPPAPHFGFWSAGRTGAALSAITSGQDGFFKPRPPTDWWFGESPVSYYDTSELRSTLERLVDFDRINAREMHFSVGAANVETGDFVYFDNMHRKIGPEHIMASGALPPAFAPVEVDGEDFWDGGLISNTPLQYAIDYVPRRSSLIFQIDLFSPHGMLPTDLDSTNEREKDIRYSSRTRSVTDSYRVIHDVRHNINRLMEKLPPEFRNTAEANFLYGFGCVTTMDIVNLIYRPEEAQGPYKDFEFSAATMNARWAQGLGDGRTTLASSPWLGPMPENLGARVFDVLNPFHGPVQTSLAGVAAGRAKA
jgi:NTE family protein